MTALARFSMVFLLAGLALLAAFVGWWVWFGDLGPVGSSLGVATSVLLLFWAWLDQHKMGDMVTSRAFLYGASSNVLVLVAVVLASAVYGVARDHDQVWDLTSDKHFSLSTQTLNVLDGLTEPVTIYGFHRTGTGQRVAFEQLTRRFQDASQQIDVIHVDPLREPDMARKYGVVGEMGTVVVVAGERTERLDSTADETQLTNLLVTLTALRTHRICWSVGHGEADARDVDDPVGMGGVVSVLEGQNYTVTPVRLLTETIPTDCEVLVVAAPLVDFLAYERESLAAYLGSAGQVFLMLDVATMPELSWELARYGIAAGNDQVFDISVENSLMGVENPSVVVLSGDNLSGHPITRPLRAAVVLGMARSIDYVGDVEGISGQILLRTGPEAWGETTLDPEAEVIPNEGERVGQLPMGVVIEIEDPGAIEVAPEETSPGADRDEIASRVIPIMASLSGTAEPGSFSESLSLRDDLGLSESDILQSLWTVGVTLGVEVPQEEAIGAQTVGDTVHLMHRLIAERTGALTLDAPPPEYTPTAGGRMVVIGDGDFASGQLVGFGNNKELFLNTIAWLAAEENQLGERPEAQGDSMQPSAMEFGLMCLISVFLVPGAAVLLALIAWLRRRAL